MRILLATAGSRGDVEPFAALARRAMAEGHDVRLVAPDNSGVDLAGLDVVSMGVDYTRVIEEQGVSPLAAMRSFRSVVRPIMRGVIVESARSALDYAPDAIVSHPKVLSAALVADALGIPAVRAELVPTMTATAAFPAAGTVTRDLGRLNRLTYRLGGASAAMFRGELDDAADLIGVRRRSTPPPPAATLLPISPAILDRPGDWDQSVHVTGPWRTPTGAGALPDEIASFVAAGDVVYAGFGSMASGDPVARAREVVRGIRDSGARALLVSGLGGLRLPPRDLGDDVLMVSTVDHDTLLPMVRAVVHHGGIGTVHATIRAGAGSVIVPFVADQPFWGARIHARGLSPAPIPQKRLTSSRLTAALAEIDQHRPAVARASRTIAAEDGAGAALEVISRLV